MSSMPGPLPAGYYWVRVEDSDGDYQPAYQEAGRFWLIGMREALPEVSEVGPPIDRPDV